MTTSFINAAFSMHPWHAANRGPREPHEVTVATSAQHNTDNAIDTIIVIAIDRAGVQREIMIEIADGNLIAHAYDAAHDEPVTFRIGGDGVSIKTNRDEWSGVTIEND